MFLHTQHCKVIECHYVLQFVMSRNFSSSLWVICNVAVGSPDFNVYSMHHIVVSATEIVFEVPCLWCHNCVEGNHDRKENSCVIIHIKDKNVYLVYINMLLIHNVHEKNTVIIDFFNDANLT